MNQTEARLIADKYLAQLQESSSEELAFNDEVTEDHPVGFVFFYNTSTFWQTRDCNSSLAGNGPLLVRRDNGEIVVLPSNQSSKRSLRALESSAESS